MLWNVVQLILIPNSFMPFGCPAGKNPPSAYKDLYGFLLLIALLVCRPTGLFGERERSV